LQSPDEKSQLRRCEMILGILFGWKLWLFVRNDERVRRGRQEKKSADRRAKVQFNGSTNGSELNGKKGDARRIRNLEKMCCCFLDLFSRKRLVCLLLGIDRLPLTVDARIEEAKITKKLEQSKLYSKTGIVMLQVKCA
jgi:hypothetical protein